VSMCLCIYVSQFVEDFEMETPLTDGDMGDDSSSALCMCVCM